MPSGLSSLTFPGRLVGGNVAAPSEDLGVRSRQPTRFQVNGADKPDGSRRTAPDAMAVERETRQREARITRLRNLIRSGGYRVDVGRLARRLLHIFDS